MLDSGKIIADENSVSTSLRRLFARNGVNERNGGCYANSRATMLSDDALRLSKVRAQGPSFQTQPTALSMATSKM